MTVYKIILLFIAAGLISACSPKASVQDISSPTEVSKESWRSETPKPGNARNIELGSYSNFELTNGLKVIVVENNKLPKVSYQISLNNDPILEGDRAGYVSFVGSLLSRGTKTKSKAEIDQAIDQIGARLYTYSSGMFLSCLTKFQDNALTIASDILQNPIFDYEEFNKLKTQSLSGIENSKDDPNSIASNIAAVVNYGLNHPYGEVVSSESVNNILLEDCINYYDTYFKPNNAILTIVGDISLELAKEKATKYFGTWQQGDVPKYEYRKPLRPDGTSVRFANKDGAVQSVVSVTYPIDLQPGSDDELKAQLMNSILGGGVFLGRLMQNLREDKAYTYGARSSVTSDEIIGSFSAGASVRNEVTDSSIVEILYEMDRIANEPISIEDLRLAKNSLAGSFARSLESPQTLAGYASNIIRYNLPQDHYDTYLKRLEDITIEDVSSIAKKYINPQNANIIVVGSKDDILERLLRFDDDNFVDYYDAYGNLITVEEKELPDGLTAQDVISKYIDACGGEDLWQSLKNVSVTYEMDIMGMATLLEKVYAYPNKGMMKIGTSTMVFQQQIFDGKKGFEKHTGGSTVYEEGPKFEQIKELKYPLQQLGYNSSEFDLAIDGVEDVDGVSCYKVKISNTKGLNRIEYYDVERGLLLRELNILPALEGNEPQVITSNPSNYVESDGLRFPGIVSTTGMGPMPFEMKFKSAEVNQNIDKNIFVIPE